MEPMEQLSKPFEEGYPVLDVEDVIRIEHEAEREGTSLLELMSRAGLAVAERARLLLEGNANGSEVALVENGCVVVLAGSGNNGGDGWVAASSLADQGHNVILISKTPADRLTAEPARTAAIQAGERGSFQVAISPERAELEEILSKATLIIDAILGTGFNHSNVREPYDAWISFANEARKAHGASILSVDCPSGLSAQTGEAANPCICADDCVTMIAAKIGLLKDSARERAGKLYIASIGIPEAAIR